MTTTKQSSSRNQRTKGLKMNHVLQILVLVGICAWLIYQVKHSHDKKKAFEAQSSKIGKKMDEAQPDIFRINRKDLLQIAEIKNRELHHNEEVDEAEETEQGTEQEDTEEDQRKVDGNGEIDEQDREREDEEAERGEFGNEEEEEGHAEKLNLVENEEHGMRSHEAQEETFKGDDVASAVAEGTQKPEVEPDGNGKSLVERVSDTVEINIEVEKMGNTANDTSNGFSDTNVVDSFMGGNENTLSGNSTSSEVGDERRELDSKSGTNSTQTESHEQQQEPSNQAETSESGGQTTVQIAAESVSGIQVEHNNITETHSADASDSGNVKNEQNEALIEEKEASSSDSVHNQNDNLEKETQRGNVSNTENVAAEEIEVHAEQEKKALHLNLHPVQDHSATFTEEAHTADTAYAVSASSEQADSHAEDEEAVKDEKAGSQENSELVLDQSTESSNTGKDTGEQIEPHAEEINASSVEEEKEGSHENSDPAQNQQTAAEETHTVNSSDVENTKVASKTLTKEEKEAHLDLSVLPDTQTERISVEEVAAG